ncbi:Ferredoxin subunit of nitrite reductase or a ring-hydroxylating dioxygenase [Nonomuraea maritima]|uniref:Ferredoxin subunit of nitrite reductase or a ring-hydroxylating dioxygenase n=1 Tax=Nonomuraea maritima TaxID=683260 RepID=A0A1G9L8G5_9ACTN|nr:Rieske 2Fe-2S domain-containing protein [Nonomuraea maritima]SDL58260.1 Ferredoxin subunit of nitrite reductase or a ring-hydroxylating dioxygenase [Nonomuraea maritima]
MKEQVRANRWQLRRFAGPVALADRLEKSKAMDKPVGVLAKAIRRRLPQSPLRDMLHGVPLGEPVHPPLATVSLGCWLSTALLDLARADPRASRLLLAAGVLNALPTAAAGLTDWSSLHREQQRVGFVHMMANLAALGLFSASLAARIRGHERPGRALSYAGLMVGGLGAYLGGHLSFRQAAGANHAPEVTHLVPLGWHDLCPLRDLPDGRPVARRLGYLQLFVLRRGEEVTVLADRCPHLAGPLHQGRLVMEKGEACVVCPWHGSTFRLADGTVKHGPATAPAPVFETRLRRDGTVQVRPGLA